MNHTAADQKADSDQAMTDRDDSMAPSTVTPAAEADVGSRMDGDAPPSADASKSGSVPASSTTAGNPSFRRQRASRACETCHARKVRCDAASLGVPCTNCVAFSIECKIPTPKRKKNQKAKDGTGDENFSTNPNASQREGSGGPRSKPVNGMPATSLTEAQAAEQAQHNHSYVQFMKPKFARAPITEAGRVAYLGESSNLSILVHDRHGTTDVVHYPLPENIRGSRARLTELDSLEIDILHQRGAFLLPPRSLCDELVDAYFKWVAPAVPIISKSRFMKRYRDPKNPPSILLLQAVLLAGSRDDRVTIVQALVLMGWYWEGPEAIIVAQGSGMHRSVEASQLSRADKRLWKRIWWTLFTRDRSVAVALGRPVNINIDDSDVEMLTEDDFIEDEADSPAEFPPDPIHVQFFLQYVKLCEIMGLVLSQQYSVASKYRRTNAMDLTHSDMALADWLQNCPREVYWERNRHHFWSALLHSHYYTTLCLLHRAHMPPATGVHQPAPDGLAYPSRTIAFQAAAMITSIVENLQTHDQLRYTPAFMLVFSTVPVMRSSVPSVVSTTQERITICMNALKEVSKVWLVAKMVCTLFESILGNKALEERLQRAAGKRHHKQKAKNDAAAPPKKPEPPKRKFDDLDISIPSGPPAHQVSYERSRPQTPAATPSIQPAQIASTGPLQLSPHPQHRGSKDGLLNPSGHTGTTRPTSPFNPSFSMPTTPPDFFLVTRNSPNLSQSLWENFQPDQLFPDGTNISGTGFSPSSGTAVDPQLQMSQHLQPTGMGSQPMGMHQQQHLPSRGPRAPHESPTMMQGMQGMGGMAHQQHLQPGMPMTQPWMFDGNMHLDASSPDDNWSNSSRGQGPVVPPTLNVEDWFQFFGINGLDSLGMDQIVFSDLFLAPGSEASTTQILVFHAFLTEVASNASIFIV
ncbi:cutinase transcription factor 1 alpha [Uncinocarpus reesii 1704]|uniref:Cutinase transcription factor 1 alpha n=1 Tax=Uncinocarpus reesii (strain UAMH 1704) TaxID=336963 RepID=C4JH99_UNCRE|nr:cutinase transcription factor 1 alpha [Uncinocarpus reesii 1704]EEP77823.1 cutinase transcription factor 1 alpha [Uncinocarpus reesii 1704]